MNTFHNQKKMPSDWHRADIIAALKKRGTSLAAISRECGEVTYLSKAERRKSWRNALKIKEKEENTTQMENCKK